MSETSAAGMRLEVLLDGRRLAIAGVEDFGVVSAIVSWVKRHPMKLSEKVRGQPDFDEAKTLREECTIEVGGLRSMTERHIGWVREDLRPGSEIIIRVLGPGDFDAPRT